MDGVVPVTLLIFLLAFMLCFLQWLHGVSLAWYGMLLFMVGGGVTAATWLAALVLSQHSERAQRKLVIALRLIGLLSFAFSMTFIMIFMYHWLNEDGHVHGASASSGQVQLGPGVIGASGRALVFTDVQMKGYRLPLLATLRTQRVELSSNQKQAIVIDLLNQSDQPLPIRLTAKVTPGAAKAHLSYPLLHHEHTLVLPPGSKRALAYDVQIDSDFPDALQPFSLMHFVFGDDDPSAWQKMQAPLTLMTPSPSSDPK